MNDDEYRQGGPYVPPRLTGIPDWFREVMEDWREQSRERWFDENGQHRAYVGAADNARTKTTGESK